jgi:hypothetical protein
LPREKARENSFKIAREKAREMTIISIEASVFAANFANVNVS